MEEYYAQGMSAEEAKAKATSDTVEQIGMAGLSGMLMGLGFGSLGSVSSMASNSRKNAKAGRYILANSSLDSFKAVAATSSNASTVKAAEKLTTSSKASAIGEVFNSYKIEVYESAKEQLTTELKKNGAGKSVFTKAEVLANEIIDNAIKSQNGELDTMADVLARSDSISGDTYTAFVDQGKFGGKELLALNKAVTAKPSAKATGVNSVGGESVVGSEQSDIVVNEQQAEALATISDDNLQSAVDYYNSNGGNIPLNILGTNTGTSVYKGLEAAGLINQDGTVNATALMNEHNRRNGSENSVDKTTANKYNDVRGEKYVPTDEFRGLQTESQGMSDEERQFYLRGGKNESVRGRISAVFKRQMDSWRSSGGSNNGLLKLTAKDNQFNIYENVDSELFHDIFEIARNYLQNGELVDLHTIETTEDGVGYNDCYNYLSEDGLSGFSITPDGDLISVFNASGKSGFLRAIAPIVKKKAKTLDCYASPHQNLMEMYERTFGFKTASIMEYNMDFDHDNIAQNHNKPKIAFMVNTEVDVETKEFSKDEYDEAVAYRNSFVEKADSDNGSAFSVDENQKVNSKRVNREKKITPKEEEIVRKVGKALGLEVEFADLGWADGKITGNKVTINIYATNPVRAVIKHEFTHSFESSKHYSKFQQYVTRNSKAFKQWLKENGFETTAQAIKETQERYAAQNEELTYPEAKAEVIADFVGDMLFNKGANITDSITEDFLSELARADRNLFERFAEWIESLVKRLKGTAVEKDIVKLEQMVKRLKETTDSDNTNGKTKYSYAGEKAKTADKLQLETAKQMLKDGADSELIRRETGWFKGMDGKWRFEINDKDIGINRVFFTKAQIAGEYYYMLTKRQQGKSTKEETEIFLQKMQKFVDSGISKGTLEKYITHKELFKAYPQLKKVGVSFDMPTENWSGKYDPLDNKIVINCRIAFEEDWLKKVFVHEIQHAIQYIEGFAKGSSNVFWDYKKSNGETFIDENGKELSSYELYERTAGEIEANDAMNRRDFSDAKRKATRPDIDRENVVFAEKDSVGASYEESVDSYKQSGYNKTRGENNGGKETNVSGGIRKTLERPGGNSSISKMGRNDSPSQIEKLKRSSKEVEAGADRSWGVERRQIGDKTYDVITEKGYTPAMKSLADENTVYGYKTCFVTSSDFYGEIDGVIIIPYQKSYPDEYVYNKGVASFTEQRLNYLLEEHSIGSDRHTDYSKAYIAYISPGDFLNLTANEPILDRVKAESTKLDTEQLRKEPETPFLEYDPSTGEVVNHEGRHRMVALKEDGIEKVAVVIKPSSDSFERRQPQNISLTGQNFKDGRAVGKVTVSNAIPLSEKYRSEAVAQFAKNPDADIRYSIPRDKSIKEQLKESGELLKAMEVVASFDENRIFKNKQDVAEWVLSKFASINYKVNRNGFGEIILDKKRVKKGLSYLKTNEERLAFALVPKVLNNGIEIGSHPKHKGRDYDTVTFAGPIEINGQRGNMAVVVRQEDKNYYKVHRLLMPDGSQFVLDEKRDIAETAGGVDNNSGLSPTDNVSTNSISDSNQKVNSKYSLPKNAIGKSAEDLKAMVESGEITLDEAFESLTDQYGAMTPGENPKVDVTFPKKISKNQNVMRYARNAAESGHLDEGMSDSQRKEILKGGMTYKVISDKSAVDKADEAVKTDFEGAVRKWEDIINSGKLMNKYDIALGERLLQQAAENGHTSDTMKYIAELAEVGTRMGQNIQALSLLKKMTGIGKLYYIQRSVDSLNGDIEQKYGGKKKQIEIDPDFAQMLAEAKTGEDAEAIADDMIKDIADQVPSTFIDKWNAWRYLSMLGNPRTHIRNIAGNAVFVPAIRIKDGMAYVGERFISKDKRTKVLGTLKAEYKDFARDDFKEMQDILTGGGKMNPSDQIRDKQSVFKNKLLEALRVKNFEAMETEDMLFLKMHYVRALGSIMQARGLDVNNISAEQLNEARLYAVKEAQKATYRDSSAVAEALNRFQYSKSKSVRSFGLLVEGVLPFKKTPINILKRGIEYSPIGLTKSLTKGVVDLKKGKITASEFIDGISAGLTGTGIMILGAFLQSLGIVVGGLGYDDEDALERMAGAQEYALQIGDVSYTIDWMAPAVLPFLVGAEVQKFLSADEERSTMSFFVDAVTAIGEPMTELSMLSGLNDAIEAVAYSDNKLTDMVLSSGMSYLSQALPTVGGQIARTADDTRRANYIDKNSDVPTSVQSFYQKAIGKVPGLENTKTPYIDAWGRTESTGNIAGRALQNFVSPGYVSKVEDDTINKEIARLYVETGEGGVIPQRAKNSFEVNGSTKYLTSEEYVKYATEKGQTARKYAEELFGHPMYLRLDNAGKADVLKNLYSYANAKAKSSVSDYDLESVSTYKTAAKLEKAGVDPVDYYIAKTVTSVENADKDGSGTVTKSEYTSALKKSGLSSTTQKKILNQRYPSKK